MEYESVWGLGANTEIYDLEIVGELNYLCNDLGLDTIEAGGTLGVAMEAGLIEFGDGKGAIELLEEIRFNTAYIDSKVANAIEETEDLLKHILAVLEKR